MAQNLRQRLHEVIFEADTRAGKAFDIILLVLIALSVLVVMLESVQGIGKKYATELYLLEWAFTVLFSIEYLARIYVVRKPSGYIFSFYGLIDLLALLPTYLSLLLTGTQLLIVIRIFRLLRIFRIFKLARYLGEADQLLQALRNSIHKITIFLVTVVFVSVTMGTIMYLIEGPENGFTSIPRGIYWAIVTLTTVGYGDISPQTPAGQTLATFLMITGYGIIAVPTGIVTAELTMVKRDQITTQVCPSCSSEGHGAGAIYCYECGEPLNTEDFD